MYLPDVVVNDDVDDDVDKEVSKVDDAQGQVVDV